MIWKIFSYAGRSVFISHSSLEQELGKFSVSETTRKENVTMFSFILAMDFLQRIKFLTKRNYNIEWTIYAVRLCYNFPPILKNFHWIYYHTYIFLYSCFLIHSIFSIFFIYFKKFTFAINGKETKYVIGNRTREYSKSVQISLFWLRDPLASFRISWRYK